jgi:hypothetical protein
VRGRTSRKGAKAQSKDELNHEVHEDHEEAIRITIESTIRAVFVSLVVQILVIALYGRGEV